MTAAHLFYIPIVFLLGLLLGFSLKKAGRPLVADEDARAASGAAALSRRSRSAKATVIALAIFTGVFTATHMFPLFGGSKALSIATGGKPLLDQRPSFSSEEVHARLAAFGPSGREMYKRFTYSTDVVFPLFLLAFLVLLAKYVAVRTSASASRRLLLLAMPWIWLALDMLENATVFRLIAQFPGEDKVLGGVIGYLTLAKFGMLLMCVTGPLAIWVLYLARSARQDQDS